MSEAEDVDDGKSMGELLRRVEEHRKNNKVGNDIRYPIEVASVDIQVRASTDGGLAQVGQWVATRLAKEDKTYLGVYLGRLPISADAIYNIVEKKLTFMGLPNPAMYVPDLKRVVYGMESWWHPLKKAEDLATITDQDIENVWYVRAMRDLTTASV